MTSTTGPGRAPRGGSGLSASGGRSSGPRTRAAALVFLSPAMLVILAFTVVPMLLTFWISFHEWSMFTGLKDMRWVGLDNYATVITDDSHWAAMRNTATYCALSVLITVPLAFLVACLLFFPRLRGRGLVQMLLFATYVIPTVAIVVIWGNLYAPDYGPIPQLLQAVGIDSPAWLSDPDWALVALVIFNVWQMLGYYVVLLVAGLTHIPTDLFEAATVDGAGLVRQGWSIVIPLLRRSLVFVALMTLINSVQVFDPVYLLTQGGPADSTNVISYDIQRAAFQNGLAGEASAMAFSLFLLLVLVTGTLLGLSRRFER